MITFEKVHNLPFVAMSLHDLHDGEYWGYLNEWPGFYHHLW